MIIKNSILSHFRKLFMNSSLRRLCRTNKLENNNHVNTVSYFISKWGKCFEENEVSEAKLSIEYILQHLLGLRYKSELTTVADQKLTEEQESALNKLCLCRLTRMPVQYIIGEWDFSYVTMILRPPVFIPRPETEELVELIVKKFKNKPLYFLDLGCGSGAIALSLLHQIPQASCVALDQSQNACLLTLQNARNLKLEERLQIFHGKITQEGLSGYNLTKKFDVIVSNPPYIPQKELFELQPEIKLFEDMRALNGGRDGMEIIKQILNYVPNILSSNGYVYLEVHPTHPCLIQKYILENNIQLQYVETHKDFSGKYRFVELHSKTTE